MEELIKQLLGEKSAGWIEMLTSQLGFSGEEANGFLPTLIEKITGLVTGGGINLGEGFDLGAIVAKINPSEIASKVGIDEGKAEAGIKGLLPEIASSFMEKAGGASDLLSMLGGDDSDAGGLIGKLFGQ